MREYFTQLWRSVYRAVTGHNTAGETAENMRIIAESETSYNALREKVIQAQLEYGKANAELEKIRALHEQRERMRRGVIDAYRRRAFSKRGILA